jgi:hypothetical protein
MQPDAHAQLVLPRSAHVFVRDAVLQSHHRLHCGASRRKAYKRAIAGCVDDTPGALSRTGRHALFEHVEVQLLQPSASLVAEVSEVRARFDDVGEGEGCWSLESARQLLRQQRLQTDDLGHRQAGGVERRRHGTGELTHGDPMLPNAGRH